LIDIGLISVVVSAVSLSVAASYYVMNIKNAQKNMRTTLETRQAQLFMQIYSSFHEEEFFEKFTNILSWKWKDYDDFMGKYGYRADPKAWRTFGSVGAFFEGIGVLVHRGLIDVDLVGELLSRHIVFFWDKIKPISLEMRRRLEVPVDVWLEYLYNEVKPVMSKQRLD